MKHNARQFRAVTALLALVVIAIGVRLLTRSDEYPAEYVAPIVESSDAKAVSDEKASDETYPAAKTGERKKKSGKKQPSKDKRGSAPDLSSPLDNRSKPL